MSHMTISVNNYVIQGTGAMLANEWGEKSINTKLTKLFEAEKDTDLTPDKGFDTVKGF